MAEDRPGFGIQHAYPRLPVSTKFRSYLQISRPLTWAAAIVGGICGALLAAKEDQTSLKFVLENWRYALHGIGTLVLVVVAGNFVNASADHRGDAISKAYRPVPRGLVSPEEAATIGHILYFAALARAATLGAPFGVIVLLLVLFSYLYSTPPIRMKASPWVGNIGVALPRGMLGLVAAWSLWASPLHPAPWAAGAVLALFLVGATTAKDFSDEAGDRAQGVRTLVVRYGPVRASVYSLPFALSPILAIPAVGLVGWVSVHPVAYAAASAACAGFGWLLLFGHARRARIAENTWAWLGMYLTLLILLLAFVADLIYGLAV